jgi:carnitine 3-dehydrogenase
VAIKREIFAELGAATGPDILLASSSSGIRPSEFQDACAHPERVLVAHPFYPPHLMPLVEVVGGRRTSDDAIASALAVLRSWGKTPIRLRAELPGHVANRLQAALWREAYDLVRRGVVSVADLDVAISAGPGLRWALLGPLATQHLSGGPGGLAHVLAHLGPPMVDWWHDLGAPPELTPDLVARLVEGVTAEFGGREAEIAAARDRALRELLAVKHAAGLDERKDTAAPARPRRG